MTDTPRQTFPVPSRDSDLDDLLGLGLEVQCSPDGHRLHPRRTFTAVGYPTLSGEVLEAFVDDASRIANITASRVHKFPEDRLLFCSNSQRGTLARLAQESLVDQRRLEKAEWEEQLVARTFQPMQTVHWDLAEIVQRTPPHKVQETIDLLKEMTIGALGIKELLEDVTLPRLGGKPLTAGYLRSFPIAVSQPSDKPAVPDDGRRWSRTLDGTEYFIGDEPPAAKPRTETWTGLNGMLTLEDGTKIPVRDGTLTITHKD